MVTKKILNSKSPLSVFVIASFCLGFFNTAIAEYEVLSKEPEKEKFVNPFPKDKFVFMEIVESYYGNMYSGMLLRPLINFNFDQKEKTVRINIPSERPDNDTLMIIGHIVGFRSRKKSNGGGRIFSVFKINSLPCAVDITTIASQFPERNLVEDLTFLSCYDDGIVRMKYGKKEILLRPGESWSTSKKKVIKLQKLKHTFRITNYGLLDKKKTKDVNLQWDQRQKK